MEIAMEIWNEVKPILYVILGIWAALMVIGLCMWAFMAAKILHFWRKNDLF